MSQSFFDTIGLILGNTDAGRLKISETWCLPACWVCANIRPVREHLLLNRLKFLSGGHQYYHPLPGQLKKETILLLRSSFFHQRIFTNTERLNAVSIHPKKQKVVGDNFMARKNWLSLNTAQFEILIQKCK